jgi:hypothetical protein
MATEKRNRPRKPFGRAAFIYTSDGQPIGASRVVNISETGAKLTWELEDDAPTEFLLVLSRDGHVRRRCLTKWHKDGTIGCSFVVK